MLLSCPVCMISDFYVAHTVLFKNFGGFQVAWANQNRAWIQSTASFENISPLQLSLSCILNIAFTQLNIAIY